MTGSSVVVTHVFLQTNELKQAIVLWGQEHNMSVQEVIQTVSEQMLDSNDFSSNIEKFRKIVHSNDVEKLGEGLTNAQVNSSRCVTCGFDPKFLNRVDKAISTLGQGKKAKLRTIFINEAIRRYLEPHLIEYGFLSNTAFPDYKQGAKNLKALRLKLGLSQAAYNTKYFAPKGSNLSLLSVSQYAMIERTGKGSLDRLIELISTSLRLDKARFYDSTLEFAEYIKDIT